MLLFALSPLLQIEIGRSLKAKLRQTQLRLILKSIPRNQLYTQTIILTSYCRIPVTWSPFNRLPTWTIPKTRLWMTLLWERKSQTQTKSVVLVDQREVQIKAPQNKSFYLRNNNSQMILSKVSVFFIYVGFWCDV